MTTTPISATTRRTLAALHTCGPCSIQRLAAVLRMPWEEVQSRILTLRSLGLATRMGGELFDVTEAVRKELKRG